MIIQVISAFFATYLFSIIFNISKRQLLYCGICGAVGWCIYLVSLPLNSVVLSTFLGALAVRILAQIFAVIRKTPVTVFLIAGIIPLVPGAVLYQAIYYIAQGEYDNVTLYGLQSLKLAGAIAVAMVLVSSTYRPRRIKRDNNGLYPKNK